MNLFKFFNKKRKKHQIPECVSRDKKCPNCNSILERKKIGGRNSDRGYWDGVKFICQNCGEVKLEAPFIPDNDSTILSITTRDDGETTCPCCGFKFNVFSDYSFCKGRHTRCGQRLHIKSNREKEEE